MLEAMLYFLAVYSAQTSFIPITVALSRFIESNGFGGLYPYWYLGTTPVKYLTGPVVPTVLVGLHKILPNLSFFDLSYLVILVALVFGAAGWGIFAWRLSGRRVIGVIGGLGVFILPWHWVSALALSEVSAVVAAALTPWVLWAFVKERSLAPIKKRSTDLEYGFESQIPSRSGLRQHHMLEVNSLVFGSWLRHVFDWGQVSALPAAMFALLLLTNTTASIPAIVGLILLSVLGFRLSDQSRSVNQSAGNTPGVSLAATLHTPGVSKELLGTRGDSDKVLDGVEGRSVRAILVILLGGVLSTFWYGIDYWLTTLGAPSIGGQSAVLVLVSLVDRLRYLVPLILVIVIVLWKVKPRGVYQKFTLIWLVLFGSLTLFRFLADWDFWMDWTSWMGEVEVGIALIIASNFQFSILNFQSIFNFKFSKKSIFYSLFTIYILGGWFLAWQKRDFWLPRRSIEDTVEFKIAKVLEQETGNFKQETGSEPTVFLSGSTAFWLNALVDVKQVRGGRDEASVDDRWREVAWEVRQGGITEGTERVLRALSINYIVVHTEESAEFYHDFVYPGKFEGTRVFEKVYEDGGDRIYEVNF